MSSLPVLGSLLYPDWNGIAWVQSGGPGTTVLPGPNDGPFGYPVPGVNMQESGSGLWPSVCGHWLDTWEIFMGYDEVSNQNAAIVACPVCSCVNRIIIPYSNIYNTVTYQIVFG